MFTTGSKLLLGGTVASVVGAIVFAQTNGAGSGYLGTVALLAAAVAFAFLFGINLYVRDGNVPANLPDAATASAAAQRPAGRSAWPAIGALALGLLVVGAQTKPIVFKLAIVLLLAVAVEWMVQGWSERASADPAYNATLRKRILHPLELPILGGIGLAVIIYSFSRIMLFLSKSSGPFAFIVLGVLITVFAFTFALRPTLKKGVIIGVCTVAALGIVSAGAVTAVGGQRQIDRHPTTADDSAAQCTRDAAETESNPVYKEIDHRGSQNVSAKSNPAARVVLENGQLRAFIVGFNVPLDTITVSRSNPTNLLFTNKDADKVRLTAYAGSVTQTVNGTTVKVPRRSCTTLVRNGGEQMFTVTFPKSSAASPDDPYTLTVPGLTGQQIKVVVP